MYGEDDGTENDIRQWFDLPDVGMYVAVRPDGSVCGYADVSGQGDGSRFWIDLRVPPGDDHAEIGAVLLETAESAAGRGANLKTGMPSLDRLGAELLRGHGYELVRHSFQMRIDISGEIDAPVWPAGIAVRPFRPGRDDEAVYRVQQETFADQFDYVRQSYEEWRSYSFLEPHDPSLWFLAEDGAELAGISLCRPQWAGDPGLGWVSALGVRRPWRRQGLGLALLLHSFAALRVRGNRHAGLGVDGLNPTGAVRLYERAGMHVIRRFDQYKKSLV